MFSLFPVSSKFDFFRAFSSRPMQGLLGTGLLALMLASGSAQAQFPYDTEWPEIGYGKVAPQDSFSRKVQALEADGRFLDFEADGSGFLNSLLQALDIDPSSQVLVFSKTSLKQRFISPQVPRSLFFNDEV